MSSVNKAIRFGHSPDLSAVCGPLGLGKFLDLVGHDGGRPVHVIGEAHVVSGGMAGNECLDRRLIENKSAGFFGAKYVAELECQHRVLCSREPGPSRYERRCQHRSSHAIPPRNLGVIEGERLQRARGYHEEYEAAKALAALAAIASILFCVAVIAGAV